MAKVMTDRYFADMIAARPNHSGQVPGAVGVLDAPDHPMPIGMANCTGLDSAGLAVWRLTVEDADVPGRWVIVDRRFEPVEVTSA